MFVPAGFTHHAQKVVAAARTDAAVLQHDHVSTEHLLLGLLGVAHTKAELVLTEFGLTRDVLLEGVRGSGIGWPGGDARREGAAAFTPQVRKVLELARDEAQLRDAKVAPEHLLLALIREGQGVAVQLLGQSGAAPAVVRRRLLEVMAEAEDSEDGSVGGMPDATGGGEVSGRSAGSTAQAGGGSMGLDAADHVAAGCLTAGGGEAQRIVGRDREIDRLARILSRRHDPHAVVFGEPGVGKTALIRGLIWELTEGRLRGLLLGRREICWVSPDTDRAALGQWSGLIVVDGAGLAPNPVELLAWAAGLPGPVVLTLVAPERALIGRFGTVHLTEPDRETALAMVRAACADLERHYQVVSFTDAAIARAVDAGGTLPNSAVRLLDDAAALALVTALEPRPIDVAEVEAVLADPA